MARHVLVGTGPAAIAAAEGIRGLDPRAEIVAVGPEPERYYSRPGLAYYLAREVPRRTLLPMRDADLGGIGVRFVWGRAAGVDASAHRLTLESGEALDYDRLLLATGSRAVPLDVPGASLDGVVKLDDLADADDIIRRSHSTRAAVVVGGGITALEIAEGLAARGVRVHYLMRKDRYWANVLSEAESRLVEQGLRDRGVEVHPFTELAAVLGSAGRVAGIRTADGRGLPCGMVAAAIGVRPQVGFARDLGVECARGVLVDEYLRTSAPDVFAAGDIAEVREGSDGRGTIEVLWNSAVEKGRVAGRNMAADEREPYLHTPPLNVTRLAGFKLTIMGTVGRGADADVKGIVRGDSETWRRLGDAAIVETETEGAHVRLALTKARIAGAVVMGDQALSFPLQELVAARADLGSLAEELQRPDAPVAELIRRCGEQCRVTHA